MTTEKQKIWDKFINSIKPGDTQDRILGLIYGYILSNGINSDTEICSQYLMSNTCQLILKALSAADAGQLFDVTERKKVPGDDLSVNGLLARASILGIMKNPEQVEEFVINLSNADPRCKASCVLQSMICHKFIYNNFDEHYTVDNLISESTNIARKYLFKNAANEGLSDSILKTYDDDLARWMQIAYTGKFDTLKTDVLKLNNMKIESIFGYLAGSIWTLQVIKIALSVDSFPSFKKIILKTTDTNCTINGATLGAFLGYSRLPKDWLNVLQYDSLNDIVIELINKLN